MALDYIGVTHCWRSDSMSNLRETTTRSVSYKSRRNPVRIVFTFRLSSSEPLQRQVRHHPTVPGLILKGRARGRATVHTQLNNPRLKSQQETAGANGEREVDEAGDTKHCTLR